MDNEINCPFGHAYTAFELDGAPGDKLIMINNTIDSPHHFAPYGAIYSANINDAVVAKTTMEYRGLTVKKPRPKDGASLFGLPFLSISHF
jgi:hypothetical protein